MTRHKLDFRNKNHLEQLAMFERIITSLDALPADQREDAYLEELRTITTAARASHLRIASLRGELKAEISRRKTLFDTGRRGANRAGVGALLKTGMRDATNILAVGLDLHASNKTPVGLPAAPTNLRAVPTAGEGEAMLRWKRTVRRCSFEVQWHTDPPDADHWHSETTCFPQKCLVQGLVSGAKYWFRVRASNAHGQSAWSNLAPVRVK
ncbi:MAG: Fibronectin type domain [Verrucomicrobiota bacterium]|jgi:Fibronectin type III domain